MAELISDTEGPFEQFEECDKKECNFYSEDGRCSFETCIYDNEFPVTKPTQSFKCKVCDNICYRDPREMKIMICDDCLRRIQATEKKPFTCVFCGKSQSHNSIIPISGICDKCFNELKQAKDWRHRH